MAQFGKLGVDAGTVENDRTDPPLRSFSMVQPRNNCAVSDADPLSYEDGESRDQSARTHHLILLFSPTVVASSSARQDAQEQDASPALNLNGANQDRARGDPRPVVTPLLHAYEGEEALSVHA